MSECTALMRVATRPSAAGVLALRRRMFERAADEAILWPRAWLEALEPRRLMSATVADVALDTTFGAGGYVSLNAPSGQSIYSVEAASILPAPDGSMYVEANLYSELGSKAAYPNGQIGVAHVFADGSPDRSFGTGGWAIVPSGAESLPVGDGKLKLLPDGKLLIFDGGDNMGFGDPVSVTRLNADGSPDATFGVGGTATFDDVGDGGGIAGDFQQTWIDAAGRINLFGLVPGGSAGTYQTMWLRLNLDGTPDTAWSPTGMVQSAAAQGARIPAASEWIAGSFLLDAKPRPGGGVVAYLETDYETGGVYDVFGGDSAVNQIQVDASGTIVSYRQIADVTMGVPDVVEQVDGGAWVLGGKYDLSHVTPDGRVDVDVDAPGGDATFGPFSLAVQPDGKVLVTGSSGAVGVSAVRRFNADGSVDATFAGGLAATGLVGSAWWAGAALSGGGVVLGNVWSSDDGILHLVKLLPSGGVPVDDLSPAPGDDTGTGASDNPDVPPSFASAGGTIGGLDGGNGLFADVAGSSVWNPDGSQDVFA